MNALLSKILVSGLYLCSPCSRDDLCPQNIKVLESQEETVLKVTYEGDCAGDGPYTYLCQKQKGKIICDDPSVSFEIISPESYLWSNNDYQIKSVFKKSSP